MTLIIGLKSKNIAILGADTQVSSKIKRTKEIVERSLLHKLDIYPNSIFSYLGTWDFDKENTLDHFRGELKNKFFKCFYAKSFVKKLDRDAVLIGFTKVFRIYQFIFLGKKANNIQTLKLKNRFFLFNDPYSDYENYETVKMKIIRESKISDNTLFDNLFLINNLILGEIIKGKDLDLPMINNNLNVIGGYVTISILTTKYWCNLLPFKCSKSYNLFEGYNAKTLLDGNTSPFGNSINFKEIKYIDNLAMIFYALKNPQNIGIKQDLFNWLELQINHIKDKNLISCYLLRLIVIHINTLIENKIPEIDCANPDELIFDDGNELDIDYCYSFFN
ncbi:hypothetical protein WNY78_06485 [Psychroserpens sp. AS72]|uniref:hypothetical protein n=1 Tax=Psychroserpens sp. AS72 TaxID=3135775 RepID=UPI0031784397